MFVVLSALRRIFSGRHLIAVLLLLSCCITFTQPARAQEVSEEQIKAVFLYNLSHFVVWPEEVMGKNATFDVGVMGDTVFRLVFKETVRKETIGEKQFVVESIGKVADITEKCRIIFISGQSSENWKEVKEAVAGLPILTVSDDPAFTRKGGMVSLVRQGKKITIEVNYKTVQKAGLKMSAKLLRLAKIVE